MYICINCEKLTGANFVDSKWRCPTCGIHVFTQDSDKADSLRKLLGVQPRRVTVTKEQAAAITLAHRDMEIEHRRLDSAKQCLDLARAKLDAVMAEINGEAEQ